jgi:hypothetical protein
MLAASSLLKIIVIAAYRFSTVAPLPFGIRATSAALYNKGFPRAPLLQMVGESGPIVYSPPAAATHVHRRLAGPHLEGFLKYSQTSRSAK